MVRRTFTLVSAVSLVLFVGTAVLWIVSLKAVPSVRWCRVAGRVNRLAVYRGRAVFAQWEESPFIYRSPHNYMDTIPIIVTKPGIVTAVERMTDWDDEQSAGWRIGEDVHHFAGVTLLWTARYRETAISLLWPLTWFLLLPTYRLANRCVGTQLANAANAATTSELPPTDVPNAVPPSSETPASPPGA